MKGITPFLDAFFGILIGMTIGIFILLVLNSCAPSLESTATPPPPSATATTGCYVEWVEPENVQGQICRANQVAQGIVSINPIIVRCVKGKVKCDHDGSSTPSDDGFLQFPVSPEDGEARLL